MSGVSRMLAALDEVVTTVSEEESGCWWYDAPPSKCLDLDFNVGVVDE